MVEGRNCDFFHAGTIAEECIWECSGTVEQTV